MKVWLKVKDDNIEWLLYLGDIDLFCDNTGFSKLLDLLFYFVYYIYFSVGYCTDI